jgi:hypothetical protein
MNSNRRQLTQNLTDSSGWLKIRTGNMEGLVPASYVEPLPDTLHVHAPSTAPGRPASSYSNSSVSLSGSTHTSSACGGGGSSSNHPTKKKGPAVAPKRGAKMLKYVEAMYEYEARSDAEHSMREGERFVLVGADSGDGWTEVEKGGAIRSVPANYVREV